MLLRLRKQIVGLLNARQTLENRTDWRAEGGVSCQATRGPVASNSASRRFSPLLMGIVLGALGLNSAQAQTTNNAPPSLSSITIKGTAQVGQILTGSYVYSDAENDPENTGRTGSSFRFLNGGGTSTASGLTSGQAQSYTVSANDLNTTLAYCVTPKATIGSLLGVEQCSAPTTVVLAASPCGSSNGQTLTSIPTSNLCTAGNFASTLVAGTTTYTWGCTAAVGGSPTPCSATRNYIVTPSAGSNGSISPSIAQNVAYRTSPIIFTLTPYTGYKIQSVSGCPGALSGSVYSAGPIIDSCTLAATFSALSSQNITFGPAPSVFVGGTGTLSATASSPLSVTFSSLTPSTCSVLGSTVTGIAAGTCTVAADQSGDSSTSAAPQATQSFTISRISQSITFGSAPLVAINGTGVLNATASSGLPITFSSLSMGICSVSGSTVSGISVGTCTIAADQSGDSSTSAAPQATQSFTISRASQSIIFGSAPLVAINGTGVLNATASSGLAVTFSSLSMGICSVSGSTVSGITAGTCIVAANQSGNNTYGAAPQSTQNIAIGKISQSIIFGTAPTLLAGGTASLSASSSSSLVVTFSSLTLSTCSVLGSTVTGIAAGTCTIAADQSGDSSTSAAPQITQNITISKLSQSITFGSAPLVAIGGTGVLNATASSGLPITFSSLSTGICSVSGSTVSGISAGTCSIAADQAGNASTSAAPQITQNFSIDKVSQTIAFGAAPALLVGGTGTLSATATSGLAVTFSSLSTGICSVSGSTVSGITGGSCSVAANQGGDSKTSAAPQATQSFTIGRVSQSITFGATPTVVVGASASISATATSGLAVRFSSIVPHICTVSGSTVSGIAAGTCTLTADQSGDSSTTAAQQIRQSFLIGKGSQTITFGAAPAIVVGGSANVSASATSGLIVTFTTTTASVCRISGSTVSGVGGGNCTLVAHQIGDDNYNAAAQVTQNVVISKTGQTINFGALPAVMLGNAVNLSATATSGLSVIFSSMTPNVCSVADSSVIAFAGGTCTVAANQGGSSTYSAAPQVVQSVEVGIKNSQKINFGAAPSIMVGGTGNLSATSTSGLPVTFGSQTKAVCTVSGSVVTGVAAGTCLITASQPGDARTRQAPQVTQSFDISLVPTYTLGVDATGASGVAISASPSAYAGTTFYNKTEIAAGTLVTLTAPSSASGAAFSTWSGCDSASGSSCSLTLSASKNVIARYGVVLLGQNITFGLAPTLMVGGTARLIATASSGLPVTLSSSTPTICSIAGSTVSGLVAGSCTILAQQAGNSSTGPAPFITLSFDVVPASPLKHYQKIAHNATQLADSAVLGNGSSDWACTRDATSGLLWEVKSTDGGLRDMNRLYTNFDDPAQLQKWNGNVLLKPTLAEIDAASNSIGLVKSVNSSTLCGSVEWRMPSQDELRGLWDLNAVPKINPTFFPNTSNLYYWSGSPSAYTTQDALNVYFSEGGGDSNHRDNNASIRLVSGVNTAEILALKVSASGLGSGNISSDSGGLDCASQAGTTSGGCSASLARGTLITLTATPKDGSTFVGWSGGCTGTGQCKFPINTEAHINAQFNPIPFAVCTVLQSTASSTTLETSITFNSNNLGKMGAVYVTARVPASALSTLPMAPASPVAANLSTVLDNGNAPVTLQLTAAGWARIENGQLFPYAIGVLGDLLAAQKILDSADPRLLPGAQFCVGYGTSALEMLNNDRLQLVATIPDGGTVFSGSCLDVDNRGTATEFYHSALKHYFITIDPDEAAGIDAGAAGAGWARTTGSFKVWPNQANGGQPVCRFYGSFDPGPNSHFFTASAEECAGLRVLQASTPESVKKWHYENTAFYLFTPINGACTGGSTPVYRYYNNGFAHGEDSNHRLTADLAQRSSMEAAGWGYEGIVMCAP